MATDVDEAQQKSRPLEALLAIALQLKARVDESYGIPRNLGKEAVLLRSFGFKNSEIATVIGSTSGSVAELISRSQKTSKGAKSGKGKDRSAKNQRAS